MNDDLPGDGWIPWELRTPTLTTWQTIEIMRRDWDEPRTVTVRSVNPAMNANGLYWRPLP